MASIGSNSGGSGGWHKPRQRLRAAPARPFLRRNDIHGFGQRIQNEAANGLKNELGTLAMARTGDPHSATAQFFINLKDNSFLDYPSRDGWGYAVFGKVTQGFDIVQKIAMVPTGNAGPHQNVPNTPVVIESVKLLPAKK